MDRYDVVVVGSGVIGLAAALECATSGRRAVVVDARPARGASYVAAGMLAPVTEAAWGEEELVALNLRAAAGWPAFAERLEAASGLPVGYRACGTLLVALDDSDRAALEELLEFHRHLELPSTWLAPSACREREPMLAPGLRGGIFAPGDHEVDNRRLLGSLAEAARRAGVEAVAARAEALVTAAGRAVGVVAGGRELAAGAVVLAAGCDSAGLAGLPAADRPPVRPVKGEILRLRHPGGPLLRHTVRGLAKGHPVYVVERGDGRLVVGATAEERGDDLATSVRGAYTLLRDATRLVPGLLEVELVEASAGLRPGSPDNAPLVGPASLDGLVIATGHYRNGILLAPLTAALVRTVLDDGDLPPWAVALDPRRFRRPAAGAA
ncbi:MAG TPA: glycine oxidase ThiO [Acidimicrobiales bacterium]|nr:glycine oxidase ThiO [Acidimicrobiales bacterium]